MNSNCLPYNYVWRTQVWADNKKYAYNRIKDKTHVKFTSKTSARQPTVFFRSSATRNETPTDDWTERTTGAEALRKQNGSMRTTLDAKGIVMESTTQGKCNQDFAMS